MKIGRGVAYEKADGSFVIGCVKEIKPDSLIAVESNGTETELFKGKAHRINSEKLEAIIRGKVGITLDLPKDIYHDDDTDEGDADDDHLSTCDDLDDEPEDEGDED